jgi:hypothetical protein
MRLSNFDYPKEAKSSWLKVKPRGPLTLQNAQYYLDGMKSFITPSMKPMIEDPNAWSLSKHPGWYDVPWTGEGVALANGSTDPTSGREAILGTFSGQVIRKSTFVRDGLTTDMQNHVVIYYDPVAATTLRKIWHDPLTPVLSAETTQFQEGAIVVKSGAVNVTPEQWPVVTNAAIWHVYRPALDIPTEQPLPGHASEKIGFEDTPQVMPLRVLQFDMIVKDAEAAPDLGFVFLAWVYSCPKPAAADCGIPGSTPWDRMVPLGASWGDDPTFARTEDGTNPDPKGPALLQTWINPDAPAYAKSSLGWGGRLSGPIDVSVRHHVRLTIGERLQNGAHVSSCISCHSTAQYPFDANLYPSPNITFPQDGQEFLIYPPGSDEFGLWFQNIQGTTAFSSTSNSAAVGLSYDMVQTFILRGGIFGGTPNLFGGTPNLYARGWRFVDPSVRGLP